MCVFIEMTFWSEEECRNFELGLVLFMFGCFEPCFELVRENNKP